MSSLPLNDPMYQKTVLDNGVTIVTEQLPHIRSISLGTWIVTGSRDEDSAQNGIAHFIEHMFFKGTQRRSALEISKEIDSVGGILNALTSKEYTGLYVKVLDNTVDVAFDLLADIFLNSTFDPQEIEREREVIIQEIHLSEDTPDEHIQEIFSKAFLRNHPLAQPILGNVDTVGALNRDNLISFLRKKHFDPSRIIIAATGNLNHDQIVDGFSKSFGALPKEENATHLHSPVEPVSSFSLHTKDLEQVHLCIGTKGIPQDHSLRYAGYVLNTILGGSMSSRLFQEIREKKGLAYSIYSYFSSFFDTGVFAVYLGVSDKMAEEAIKLVIEELYKCKDNGITESELKTAKEHLKGNTLLASESADSRMTRLAKCEIYFDKFISLQQILDNIDRVTAQDVKDLGQTIFDRNYLSLAALGPVNQHKLTPALLDA
jgi:predicted Zn-dependent peptidase